MAQIINAKTLRHELARIVARVRKGEDFTVLYRSRPAFRIVPVEGAIPDPADLNEDPLFEAEAVGYSVDGQNAADHDRILYGRAPR